MIIVCKAKKRCWVNNAYHRVGDEVFWDDARPLPDYLEKVGVEKDEKDEKKNKK